ncbi:MAG TPA: universal stress protein [Trichocoleus sp.]
MFKRILVALDNSALREAVLAKALAIAGAMEADVMLLHVLSAYEEGSPGIPLRSYHSYYPILDDTSWSLYQERWNKFEKLGIEQLQKDVELATAAGVRTQFTQSGGEPSTVICETARAWNADVIVMGSRGRRGLSELLMGSVSSYVMHHAPCSVLVVRGNPAKKNSAETQAESSLTLA